MPDAIPVRAGSTTRRAAPAIVGFARPIPIPATMKPGSSTVQLEPTLISSISSNPPAVIARLAESSTHIWTRAAKLRETSGTRKTKAVIGRNRNPAPSGELPSMSCR